MTVMLHGRKSVMYRLATVSVEVWVIDLDLCAGSVSVTDTVCERKSVMYRLATVCVR